MKKLRVALIGYGRSGRDIHNHMFKQLTDKYEVTVGVEIDAQRRDMMRAELGIEPLDDYRKLVDVQDKFDFVVNASFSMDHAPISRYLLEHGMTVLSEKPAARDVADFEDILAAEKRGGGHYYVFQLCRFSPEFIKIKEIIAEGTLGRIVQVALQYDGFSRRWDWQTIHSWCAGSLRNTGPHPVDMALDLMGFPKDVRVFCAMDRALTLGDGEDYVKRIMAAPGAPVCDVQISSCNAYPGDRFFIQGTRGTLHGNGQQLEWKYFNEAEAEPKELTSVPLRNEKGEPLYCVDKLPMREGKWEATGLEKREFDAKGIKFYEVFYDTLVNGADFPIKNEEVKLQMYVMEQAHAQNWLLFEK